MNIDRLFKLYEAVEGRPASSVSVERTPEGTFTARISRATKVGVGPAETSAQESFGNSGAQEALEHLEARMMKQMEDIVACTSRAAEEAARKLADLRGSAT